MRCSQQEQGTSTDRKAFVALCREVGIKHPLLDLKGSPYIRGLKKYMRDGQADWWDACKAFRKLGVCPESVFTSDDE